MATDRDINKVIQYVPQSDLTVWANDHSRALNEIIEAYNNRIKTKTLGVNFIGQGTGATKTTTAIYGNTIVEKFGVGDEVYLHVDIPADMDITADPVVSVRLAPQAAEVAKTCSFDLVYVVQAPGDLINATDDTLQVVDVAVPATQYEDFLLDDFVLDHTLFTATSDDIHIKLARVASTSDGSDVALHSAVFKYTSSHIS